VVTCGPHYEVLTCTPLQVTKCNRRVHHDPGNLLLLPTLIWWSSWLSEQTLSRKTTELCNTNYQLVQYNTSPDMTSDSNRHLCVLSWAYTSKVRVLTWFSMAVSLGHDSTNTLAPPYGGCFRLRTSQLDISLKHKYNSYCHLSMVHSIVMFVITNDMSGLATIIVIIAVWVNRFVKTGVSTFVDTRSHLTIRLNVIA